MKISDWEERGLRPSFGHQGVWLEDDLDELNSPIAAAFAIADEPAASSDAASPDRPSSAQPRRFLLATQLGLVDAHYAPSPSGPGSMTSTLTAWPEVRGVVLTSRTGMDDRLRHAFARQLQIAHPAISIIETPDEGALIDLWRECVLRSGRSATEQPSDTE